MDTIYTSSRPGVSSSNRRGEEDYSIEIQPREGHSEEWPRGSRWWLNKPEVKHEDKSMLSVRTESYKRWVRRQTKKAKAPGLRLEKCLSSCYQRWIVDFLLGQGPLPPSKDGRQIPLSFGDVRQTPLIDERTDRPYVSNFIRSSRYTIWSFVPKQLYAQFSKLANFYFLTIGLLQQVPGWSPTGRYSTVGPLAAFVAFSMGKEGFDDFRRYQMDKVENRARVHVLDPAKTVTGKMSGEPSKRFESFRLRGQHRRNTEIEMAMTALDEMSRLPGQEESAWSEIQWQHLRVGDIIRLERDERVPADIVLLHASGPNGVAYIETMALDGETNLKSKQACPLLADRCDTLAKLKTCNATVVAEDPNIDLYNFEGRLSVDGETMPLTMAEVVYRGCTLRNTAYAIGIVINTGEECKIRINAHKNVHTKAPAIQAILNRIVILLVVFVLLLCMIMTVGYAIWSGAYEGKAWYLRDAEPNYAQIIFSFVILFNSLIPLSLMVSLEIIKIGQLMLLHDVEMYDPETDTPMVANTNTILENLGQVSYIFSDKTGTLTENKMRLRKLSVAGVAWLHDADIKREGERQQHLAALQGIDSKGKLSTPALDFDAMTRPDSRAPLIGGKPSPAPSPLRASFDLMSVPHPEPGPSDWNTESLLRYIDQHPQSIYTRKARQFLLCIALCHTCLPEANEDGTYDFQAASPDELALIKAAQDLGYLLIDRPSQSIVLRLRGPNGATIAEVYHVLDVIEFSSKRKRMSIIIRMPDGRICVFCKGADSMLFPRLRLSQLAGRKATEVQQKAIERKSIDVENALRRSMDLRRGMDISRASFSLSRRQSVFRKHFEMRSALDSDKSDVEDGPSRRKTFDVADRAGSMRQHLTPRHSATISRLSNSTPRKSPEDLLSDAAAINDEHILERCLQHINDFASDGLRTLVYGYRYIDAAEYSSWKKTYQAATTSLIDRQANVEAAGELIEDKFELAGATAIEDKLQSGVPETIEKLRRANIKVWMLTGDKRETAINIGHSTGLCLSYSEIYILDAAEDRDLQERMASVLVDISSGRIAHSVVVVDGHTLGCIEDDDVLKTMFFDLVVRIDSVICCRASPAQKAKIVKGIRRAAPTELTLAIGDGANDIAMIQASHVGIGISGQEGLQAARVADYSISQFRFLQRLLFVHGRWNYYRTCKYILGTFWKEIVFYIAQAQYQRWNGYTGTSMYESTSLTIFNTLFTSLPVIVPGIFDKDLDAETLLKVPELYIYSQRHGYFNFRKYLGWMIMACTEAVGLFMIPRAVFKILLFSSDNSIFALGQLIFTVAVLFINFKLFGLEMHHKTAVALLAIIPIGCWFLFNILLAETPIDTPTPSPYAVQGGFTQTFGRQLVWWTTVLLTFSLLSVFELGVQAVRRVYFPTQTDLWQERERDGKAELPDEAAAEMGEIGNDDDDDDDDVEEKPESESRARKWLRSIRRSNQ